jgi:hypothetical protein
MVISIVSCRYGESPLTSNTDDPKKRLTDPNGSALWQLYSINHLPIHTHHRPGERDDRIPGRHTHRLGHGRVQPEGFAQYGVEVWQAG